MPHPNRLPGSWAVTFDPRIIGREEYLNKLAFRVENTGDDLYKIVLPKGTKINAGITAENFGRAGGLPQVELLLGRGELNRLWKTAEPLRW